MKPLVTFPVPDTLMRDYLRPLMLTRPESYAPNTVSDGFPAAGFTGTHLQVELETSSTDDYPVTERAQVRFNVWAPKNKPTDAKDAASLVMAHVYAAEGVAGLAGCTILGGRSEVTTDPTTGYEMCWFLARVNLLSTPLAS